MPTQAEIAEYQSTIDGLSTVAFAQIKALLQSLDNPNPIAFRDALLRTYPELMAPFMTAASEIAATWYATLRGSSDLRLPYLPVTSPNAPVEQLEAGVRYSLSPLFASPAEFIGDSILLLLAGFTQKVIADQSRDTITTNADRDSVRVGYQRMPRAGCCAFCALMASRGAVYRTASSAGAVQGRGVEASATAGKRGGQGRGVKVRGAQQVGDSYHKFCRCVVVPVMPGGDNDYLTYTSNFYEQQYADLESRDGSIRGVGEATSLKDTLADWRFTHGTK